MNFQKIFQSKQDTPSSDLIKNISHFAIPIPRLQEKDEKTEEGAQGTYEELLNAVGDASVVLIGEASHGTDDFYRYRAEITKKLIEKKGFNMIAVEADFPDCIRITNYVRGDKSTGKQDLNSKDALGNFKRFPRWMWRNEVMSEFVEWLRDYNHKLKTQGGSDDESKSPTHTTSTSPSSSDIDSQVYKRIGFYGLDLYSLQSSREAVVDYLEKIDPEYAKKAKKHFSCFDRFGSGGHFDTSSYALSGIGLTKSCEMEAHKVLVDLSKKSSEYLQKDPSVSNFDKLFIAKVNAKVVKDAEEYYRHMLVGKRNLTWNIRDQHMFSILRDLMRHYSDMNHTRTKAVVWAHNSHCGDAKYTESGYKRGEINIGNLCREDMKRNDCFIIGFGTHNGTVTAANDWDEPPQYFRVRPSLQESYENVFHKACLHMKKDRYMLILKSNNKEVSSASNQHLLDQLSKKKLERAIGVVYRPDTERYSHYFMCDLTKQFDAYMFINTTKAIVPLEITPQIEKETDEDMDETYPFGL